MWYFSWILGTGLALAFGVLNAMWYELTDEDSERRGVDGFTQGVDPPP